MKKISFLFLIALFCGCGPSKEELEAAAKKAVLDAQDTTITAENGSTDKQQVKVEKVAQIMKPDGKGGGQIRFLTIDGHEYIQWYTSADGSSDIGVAMIHNENCSNEVHKK